MFPTKMYSHRTCGRCWDLPLELLMHGYMRSGLVTVNKLFVLVSLTRTPRWDCLSFFQACSTHEFKKACAESFKDTAESPKVKIGDFGLSKMADHSANLGVETETRDGTNTWRFASFEQSWEMCTEPKRAPAAQKSEIWRFLFE